MQRRKFSREFKIEAVRLVRERGVSVAQASRDIDVHENVVRKWVKEFGTDPMPAFPGHGQMKPEQLEIDRLRREVTKLKAERDILKKAAAFFAKYPGAQGKDRRSPRLRPARPGPDGVGGEAGYPGTGRSGPAPRWRVPQTGSRRPDEDRPRRGNPRFRGSAAG